MWRDDADGTSVQSFTVPLNPRPRPGFAAVPGLAAVNCFQLQALGACGPATANFAGNTHTYEEIEEYYSHELTIASTWDGPLQYIAGIYFYHEKGSNPVQAYCAEHAAAGQRRRHPAATGTADARPTRSANTPTRNDYFGIDSKAAYGQLDYKLTDTHQADRRPALYAGRQEGDRRRTLRLLRRPPPCAAAPLPPPAAWLRRSTSLRWSSARRPRPSSPLGRQPAGRRRCGDL